MLNNSHHPPRLSAPLCVIVCCYAQLSATELWCYGHFPSAFGCSEGNQLWQSCKLFLWRAKGAGAHTRSRPLYLFIRAQSVPMDPLSVRSERPLPGNINDMDHKKRLFSVQRERRWTEGEIQRERKGREGEQRDPVWNTTGPLCVQ